MAERKGPVHVEGTTKSMADSKGSRNFMADAIYGHVIQNTYNFTSGPGTSGQQVPPRGQRIREMADESILELSREGDRSSEEDAEIESDPQLREHLPFLGAGYTFVREIWKTVEKKLSKKEMREMINVYLEHYFEKRAPGKAKPLDADELYFEIKEQKIISDKNVIYVQILLWKINRKKLIVKVAKKAKEAFFAFQVKISHMDVPSLKPVFGCKYVRVHLDMTDQEVADVEHLHRIRREMARYLGVKPDFVQVVGLELTKSVWMTLIMLLEVYDQLLLIFYDPSLRKDLQRLKISTVIFQESKEEEDDDEDMTVYLWETKVSDPVPGPSETRKEENEEYRLPVSVAQQQVAMLQTDSEVDSESAVEDSAHGAPSSDVSGLECSMAAASQEEECQIQAPVAQQQMATFWTDSDADSGIHSTQRTDASTGVDSDSHTENEVAFSAQKMTSATRPDDDFPRIQAEKVASTPHQTTKRPQDSDSDSGMSSTYSSEAKAEADSSSEIESSTVKPLEYGSGKEEGPVSLLNPPAHLEKVYGRIKSLEELEESLRCTAPNVESIEDLTGEAILLGHKLSMSQTEGNAASEFEQQLISTTLNFCLAALTTQEAEPVDILRLFASVLWLTRSCATMEEDEKRNCVLKCLTMALFHGGIWQETSHHHTEKVIKYGWELEIHLQKRYQENPTIAYLLCLDISRVGEMFRKSNELWRDTSRKLYLETTLLKAKCLLLKGFYRTAKSVCRYAREELDYDNSAALDMWSQALEHQQAYGPAMLKAQEALKYARGDDAERIQQRILHLEALTSLPGSWPVEPKETSDSMSEATSHVKVGTKRTPEERKSRHRHKRPSPNPRNVSEWCVYGKSKQFERPPSEERLVESAQDIALPDDDLVSESDSSDHSLSSGSNMSKTPLNPNLFWKRPAKAIPPETSWFEKSLNPKENILRVQDIEQLQVDPSQLTRLSSTSDRRQKMYVMEKSEERLKQLLLHKPDRYKKCKISFTSAHVATCHVLEENSTQSIEIYGRTRIGQTFNDDEVVVEIASSRRNTGSGTSDNLYGRVVGILKRHRYSGIAHPLLACTIDQYESQLMHPICKTVPKIHVLQPSLKKMTEAQRRDKVEIFNIDSDGNLKSQGIIKLPLGRREAFMFRVGYIMWKDEEHYPLGVVLEMMESCKDFASGLKVLELQYAVHRLFPLPCILRVEDQLSRPLPELVEAETRDDLTERLTFTIDPQDSKDLDDAISLWKEDQDFVLGVHIADVTAVMEKGDAVDEEARRRGFTFYPPGGWRPYPMLPEPLIELCSLLPGEDRPALSVLFRVNEEKQLVGEPKIQKSLIRSQYQLTYAEAQDIIDGESKDEKHPRDLTEGLKEVSAIANALRRQRLKNATRFCKWRDLRLVGEERDEDGRAHALIEELMIRTSIHIGKLLFSKYPKCTLLRCQDAPHVADVQEWLNSGGSTCHLLVQMQDRELPNGQKLSAQEYLEAEKTNSWKKEHVTVRRDIWRRLQTALDEANMREVNRILSSDDPHPHQLLTFKRWTEFQERAVYRSSSEKMRIKSFGAKGNGHFSLKVDAYCHCTSPMRRYADVECHRLLKCYMEGKYPQITSPQLEKFAEDLRTRNLQMRAHEQCARDLLLADSLLDTPVQVTAVVGTISEEGFELLIPGMQSPPLSLRDVPFKLLTLSRQPELVNTVPQSVRCQWRRRVYHKKHNPAHRVKELPANLKNLPVQVNENHMVVKVTATRWGALLARFLSDDEKRLKAMQKQARRMGTDGEEKQRPGTRNNISCESGKKTLNTQIIAFERNFAPGQAVHVQLGAGCERGILVPRVSLLWVSDNLHLCLDHVREPILHFASKTLLTTVRWENLAEYVSYWIPLLEMEAVVASVQEDPGIIVEHVDIHFDLDRGGTFTLPTSFCVARCLDLGGRVADDIETGLKKVESYSEYICIRIPVSDAEGQGPKNPALKIAVKRKSSKSKQRKRAQHSEEDDTSVTEEVKETPTDEGWIWVGHGTVVATCRQDKGQHGDRIEVFFYLNENKAPPPPSLITENGAVGVIEILPVSETERRVIQSLQSLLPKRTSADIGNSLVSAIALDKAPPKLCRNHLQYAEQTEKDIEPGRSRLPRSNPSQREAIEKALTSTFSLIQGPPGTGKSYTGVKLIYLFHQINSQIKEKTGETSKVVFCGPSNKSVDLVARYALKHLSYRSKCPRLVRVYGSTLEDQAYPVPGKINKRKGGQDGECDPKLKQITLHHLIRERGKMYAEALATFDNLFKPGVKKIDPNKVGELRKKYRKLVFKASREELANHDVIFCTCAVAGNKRITHCKKIFQVIIDECGMCPEPHCLLPVIANNAKQVVLIGDHKQLRPIIKSRDAADLGLETSLFERRADEASFLDTQYRMHPELCYFPSMMFYDGNLQTGRSLSYIVDMPLSFWPDSETPHVFVHVEGEERSLTVSTEEGNEMSRSNDLEVDKVVQIIFRMLRERVPMASINVMSQYNAQCYMLRKAFKEDKLPEMNVSTVVASQGGEWDYVVFSTVRSLKREQIEDNPTRGWSQRHLGFITDQNQINVALTRARKGLIIVGNSYLLQKDPVWEQLLAVYEEKKCVVDGQCFPPPVQRPRFYQPPATYEWQTTMRR